MLWALTIWNQVNQIFFLGNLRPKTPVSFGQPRIRELVLFVAISSIFCQNKKKKKLTGDRRRIQSSCRKRESRERQKVGVRNRKKRALQESLPAPQLSYSYLCFHCLQPYSTLILAFCGSNKIHFPFLPCRRVQAAFQS
jgi:hypothetical protein